MRLRRLIIIPFINGLLFFCFKANAQYNESDSMLYKKAKEYAVSLYHENIKNESGLYNGSQYVVYAQTIQDGIPFFEITQPSNGNVTYWGVEYKNVPLLYDILKGEIITVVPSTNYLIKLNTEKVSSFEVLNHKFIRIAKDSSNKNIKTGFYDVLYDGQTAVYKKEIKTLNEDLSSGKLRTFILDENAFFIKKNNVFFTVSNKSSLLDILKDKKKEVQEFIRKNKLKIRKDKDNALPKIAAFYDEISKTQKS